jgi:hypothetical protein
MGTTIPWIGAVGTESIWTTRTILSVEMDRETASLGCGLNGDSTSYHLNYSQNPISSELQSEPHIIWTTVRTPYHLNYSQNPISSELQSQPHTIWATVRDLANYITESGYKNKMQLTEVRGNRALWRYFVHTADVTGVGTVWNGTNKGHTAYMNKPFYMQPMTTSNNTQSMNTAAN